jgi:hypothetical protein
MQVSDRVRGLASGAGCHDLLVSAGLALGLAALLGLVPLLLSVAVLASALVAQLVAERGGRPAFAYALLSAGLPWALGLSLTGRSLHELTQPLILGLAFVVLVWGAERLRGNGQASTFGAWAGQVAVLGALAGLRLPWAACVAVLLFMPPSWWLLHARAEQATGDHAGAMVLALERGAIWWWLAFLLAAVSLRQITMS